jgi:hypothetical protein
MCCRLTGYQSDALRQCCVPPLVNAERLPLRPGRFAGGTADAEADGRRPASRSAVPPAPSGGRKQQPSHIKWQK